MLKFFASEVPELALKFAKVKEFVSVDKLIQQQKFKQKKLGQGFDVKKAYQDVQKQQQILLKSYSNTYLKLLQTAINESTILSSELLQDFLVNGPEVAKCCIPFSLQKKKLAGLVAKVTALYSRLH